MALSKQEKLRIFQIFAEAKDGVTIQRLIHGTSKFVSRGGSTFAEDGHDKVTALEEDIRASWQELQAKGYIIPIDDYNKTWFKLTSKGKEYYEQLKTLEVEPLDVDLNSVIFNKKLLEKVTPAFESGNYDTAIRDACVLLEEAIRDKAGLEETVSGKTLVVDALHHDNGILTFPECKKAGEAEGVFFLYSGVMGFIRNISAHHTKRLNGQLTALQVVVFIDFLLRLLDTAQHS